MSKALQIDLDAAADEDADTVVVEETYRNSAGAHVDQDLVNEDADPLATLPEHAVVNDDGSVTLPLMEAATLRVLKGGKESSRVFEALTFHRLNGADMRAISSTSEEMQSVVTFARSTRINQAIMNKLFDKLDAADIADGGRILNHFLTRGRKTRKS